MTPDPLRALRAQDRAALNGWLAIRDSFCAEPMARQGCDPLTIDLKCKMRGMAP